MTYRRILAIAPLLLLSACSDSTSPSAGVAGTVSFTYTGAGGGSFSSTGAITPTTSSATVHTMQWAVGWTSSADNGTNVVANVPRAGGLADNAIIMANRQTVGVGTIDPACAPTGTASCNEVMLVLGAPANDAAPASMCFLESGTITISSISSTSAVGTFAGSGSCLSLSTGASSAFEVTNGSFNVPLITGVPVIN